MKARGLGPASPKQLWLRRLNRIVLVVVALGVYLVALGVSSRAQTDYYGYFDGPIYDPWQTF